MTVDLSDAAFDPGRRRGAVLRLHIRTNLIGRSVLGRRDCDCRLGRPTRRGRGRLLGSLRRRSPAEVERGHRGQGRRHRNEDESREILIGIALRERLLDDDEREGERHDPEDRVGDRGPGQAARRVLLQEIDDRRAKDDHHDGDCEDDELEEPVARLTEQSRYRHVLLLTLSCFPRELSQ